MSVVKNLDLSKGLDLILHTPGGDVSATESIIDYLHSVFGKDIRAIVPQIAMSGGTMIACSCKEILMSKHSSLGPVDPQFLDISAKNIIKEHNIAKKKKLWNNLNQYHIGKFYLTNILKIHSWNVKMLLNGQNLF